MGRAERITSVIREYDPKLYCESRDGKLCVLRKSQRIESYDYDGVTIHFVRPAPFFIFAVTTNWKMTGQPVDWGLVPIINRLREIDLWNRDLAEEIIQKEEESARIKRKDLKNESEAFLKDYRRKFAGTFNDVRVSNMDKKDKRKIGEKNGNC